MSIDHLVEETIASILARSLPEGGFSLYRGDTFRSDATAWAVMALEAGGVRRDVTGSACLRLAASQLSDGRLAVVAGHPEAYWPTSLALLAWKTAPGLERESNQAVRFLLANSGKHPPRQENEPVAHDTSISGWPWIENTHSWVEPTALAILALRVCGYASHERVLEAVKMILDRQLPNGGWNYGNTRVFGTELRPIVESTGHALCALAGSAGPGNVKVSIDYLSREASRVRTPLALSWSIFGLTAWSNRPFQARDWVLQSLVLQKKYGDYDTALLSQLMICYFTSGNFLSLFL